MKKFGLFVRGGNTHQKLAFTVEAEDATKAMKACVRHYNYQLGVDPNKMETFFVLPFIEDHGYDWYSMDSDGWDIDNVFYPSRNSGYQKYSPTSLEYLKQE